MKPPPFDYLAPGSVEETLAMLAERGADAKLLAGGQSLVPLLNFRLAAPEVIIDLNGVAGLSELSLHTETQEISVSALVRQTDAERSPLILDNCPVISEALTYVGHRAIRNRGTVVGSLAHADPSAELPLVLVLLDGSVELASLRGKRRLAASEFFQSYFTTALEPDELVVEARFPAHDPRAFTWGFEEFSRRHGDFALAAAAVIFRLDGDGRMVDPAVAVAGGGPVPSRAVEAEHELEGQQPGEAVFAAAAAAAAAGCETVSDIHASADYRKTIVAVLVEDALRKAWRRVDVHMNGTGARLS